MTRKEIEKLLEGITQGEWGLLDDEDGSRITITAPSRLGKIPICEFDFGFDGPIQAEIEANIQFIVQTPSIIRSLLSQLEDQEAVIEDYRRLTRELDAALNPIPAKQASLCDIVAQVKKEMPDFKFLEQIFFICPITGESQGIVSVRSAESGLDHLEVVTKGKSTSFKHKIYSAEL